MQKFKKAFGVMDADDSGDWVRYDDAVELINKERSSLLEKHDKEISSWREYSNEVIQQRNQAIELSKSLQAMTYKQNKLLSFWIVIGAGFFALDMYLIFKYVV